MCLWKCLRSPQSRYPLQLRSWTLSQAFWPFLVHLLNTCSDCPRTVEPFEAAEVHDLTIVVFDRFLKALDGSQFLVNLHSSSTISILTFFAVVETRPGADPSKSECYVVESIIIELRWKDRKVLWSWKKPKAAYGKWARCRSGCGVVIKGNFW